MSHLTTQQINTIRAACFLDATASAFIAAGSVPGLMDWLNTAPATSICWKSNVPIRDVGGAFKATELAGLSSLNQTRLQTLAIYLDQGVRPQLADIRAFFDDIFSGTGGVQTRAALLALWKRPMTRLEKIFATGPGTGTDASPATLVLEERADENDAARVIFKDNGDIWTPAG